MDSSDQFFSFVGSETENFRGLAETLNDVASRYDCVTLAIRFIGDTSFRDCLLEWCGPDFLTVRMAGDKAPCLVPASSIAALRFRPRLPMPLFDSQALQNLLVDGCNTQSRQWESIGTARVSLTPCDDYLSPITRFDSVQDWARLRIATPLLTTTPHLISIMFRATTPRLCLYIEGDVTDVVRGPVEGPFALGTGATGPLSFVETKLGADGFRRLQLRWTPLKARSYLIGLGDDGRDGAVELIALGLAKL